MAAGQDTPPARFRGGLVIFSLGFTGILGMMLMETPPPQRHMANTEAAYPVRDVAPIGPGGKLLGCLYPNRCLIRDLAGGLRGVAWIEDGGSPIRAIAGSPSEPLLALGRADGTVLFSDTFTGETRCHSELGPEAPRRMRFSPDGSQLAVGFERRGEIVLLSARTGEVQGRFAVGNPSMGIDAIAYLDAERLAVGHGGTVSLWDVPTGTELARSEELGSVLSLAALRTGEIAIGDASGRLSLWLPGTNHPLRQITVDSVGVMTLLTLPDGRLATGGVSGRLSLWNPATLERAGGTTGHRHAVRVAVMAGDNLISGGHDGFVKFWNLDTGLAQRQFGMQ